MSDIVERLRKLAEEWHECCGDIHVPLSEAAAEIERLREELDGERRAFDAMEAEIERLQNANRDLLDERDAFSREIAQLKFQSRRIVALLYEALSEMTGSRDYGSWSELVDRMKEALNAWQTK